MFSSTAKKKANKKNKQKTKQKTQLSPDLHSDGDFPPLPDLKEAMADDNDDMIVMKGSFSESTKTTNDNKEEL